MTTLTTLFQQLLNYKLTHQNFIECTNIKHKNTFDYINIDFQGTGIKITYYCNKCNTLLSASPYNHLLKLSGCLNCREDEKKMGREKASLIRDEKERYRIEQVRLNKITREEERNNKLIYDLPLFIENAQAINDI